MTDAWMKRGAERQRFLEAIQALILDEECEAHESRLPQYTTHAALLEHLSQRDRSNTPFIADTPSKVRMRSLLHKTILPQVKEFARTEVEELFLLSELFLWTCKSLARTFQAALLHQEIAEPGKLFEGKQATDRAEAS